MGLTTQDLRCELGFSLLNQTLRWLDLSDNQLSDGQSLWHCLAHHNFTLSRLDLSNNPLNFNLALSDPLSLVSHSYGMTSLHLSYCQLFGDLSMEILSAASNLILAHNNLAGSIPLQIGSLASQTEWIDLSFNNLTGPIPTSMGNFSAVEGIILNNNHLDGEIPFQELGANLRRISLLQLSNNSFIKASFRNMSLFTTLVILDLSFNKLEGEIQELSTLPSFLFVLVLGHNQLTGSVPTFLWESATHLVVMDLSNNKLTGAIPQSLKLIPSLRHGWLSTGQFFSDGPILPSLKNVKFMKSNLIRGYLDLSSNMLSGPIPEEIGELLWLNDLNLSNNHLWGPIPALANLSKLESLDLSYNNLQGSIPTALSHLPNLAVFNVSFNPELSGPIPQGSPQLENEDSYKGDPHLCGEFIHKECNITTSENVPGTTSSPDLDHGWLHHVWQWIEEWISIPGICLGYTLGAALTIWFLKLIHFYG